MENSVLFQADDVNDESWETIIEILKDNLPDFSVSYGDGDYMSFSWSDK